MLDYVNKRFIQQSFSEKGPKKINNNNHKYFPKMKRMHMYHFQKKNNNT